ncbi:MAG: hypothetical protein JWM71_2349 [Solirubrobacteraceae bacterium]|nr:hypothetical protein [Solirubrobacteraceae bacterium]
MGAVGYRNDALGQLEGPEVAKRKWVLSSAELRTHGLTQRQITERVASGVLHRVFRGVYAVGRPQLSFDGWCRAAWLACGPGSAVSHISAARLWGIRRSNGMIHISVPRGRKGHPGLRVHRPRSLSLDDIAEVQECAVTSVARTLLDMSPGQPVDRIAKWIHEAGVMRVLDLREIHAVLRRERHHPGRGALEAALAAEVLPTRSGLEDTWLRISRRAGISTPNVNENLWSGVALEEVDFHYPQLGLIVEVDGSRYHWSRWRRRQDAAKDERFRASGRTVWRVPELQITLEPDSTVRELRALAASLGRSN